MSKPYYETEEYSEAENELDTYDDPVKLVMEYRVSEKHKDKQISDLQYKLKVAEIATKLACERVKYFEEMQDREMGFEDLFGYESNYDLQAIIEQYKEQAEKEIKGE